MAAIKGDEIIELINTVDKLSAANLDDKLDLSTVVDEYYTARYGKINVPLARYEKINVPMIELSELNRQDIVTPNQLLAAVLINLRVLNVKITGETIQRIWDVKKLADQETTNVDERIKSKHRLIMEILMTQTKVNPEEAFSYFGRRPLVDTTGVPDVDPSEAYEQLFADSDDLMNHIYSDTLTAMTNYHLALQLDQGQLRNAAEKFLTQPGIVEAIRSVVKKIRGWNESEGIGSATIVAEARSFRLYTCAHACGWFRGVCLRDGVLIVLPTIAMSTMPTDQRYCADVLQLIMHEFTHYILRKSSRTIAGYNTSTLMANVDSKTMNLDSGQIFGKAAESGRECELKAFGHQLDWNKCAKEAIAKRFVERAIRGVIQSVPIVLFESNNEEETKKMARRVPSVSLGF